MLLYFNTKIYSFFFLTNVELEDRLRLPAWKRCLESAQDKYLTRRGCVGSVRCNETVIETFLVLYYFCAFFSFLFFLFKRACKCHQSFLT